MRGIEFRGLTESGTWAYARFRDILESQTNHPIQYFRVIPYTVDEWTGLFDSNGVKVFEGDILKYEEIVNGKKLCDKYGLVKFGEHLSDGTTEIGWYIEWYPIDKKHCPDYRNDILFWIDPKWHERYNNPAVVVGNIHEKPELLLKGNKKE